MPNVNSVHCDLLYTVEQYTAVVVVVAHDSVRSSFEWATSVSQAQRAPTTAFSALRGQLIEAFFQLRFLSLQQRAL